MSDTGRYLSETIENIFDKILDNVQMQVYIIFIRTNERLAKYIILLSCEKYDMIKEGTE